MSYRVRKRSNGITEIRRRSLRDVFLTREITDVGLLLGAWMIGTAVLVAALVSGLAVTWMAVLVGTAGVSGAIVLARGPAQESVRAEEPPAEGGMPPPRGAA